MKFKVGDKVKIRKGSLAGNIYTISHIESCGHIELSDLPYVFFDYELEPVDTDGGKIAYAPNGAPLFWMPEPEKPVSIELPEFVFDKKQAEKLAEEIKKRLANSDIRLKEEKKMPTKFTFYTTEGYRMDKSNNTKIPTITTEVLVNGKDYQYGGCATCDKADYSERDGILNAIANAVCCGNFDREYEKFLANKKRRYDESCKCKTCGRNYYEDEKTGKRTPFTPEDARKHEEWHEQNKKNKREKYLIRKEAKRRLAEAEREGKIEQVMKELYKK